MPDYSFDIETFPNAFTSCFKVVGGQGLFFEISERRDDRQALWSFLTGHAAPTRLIGFNNLGFDWPILQRFLERPNSGFAELYAHAQEIFLQHDRRPIWNPAIPQIDLYRIHHFDSGPKSTSLKALQFVMRRQNVQDLPFPPGSMLSHEEIDVLLSYNANDVLSTEEFHTRSLEKIQLRQELDPAGRWLNYSDSKLGEAYFIRELEGFGVQCYERLDGKREPRQTLRPDGVPLRDVIFPYIWFNDQRLANLLGDLKDQVIYDTKGSFERVVRFGGLDVTVGLGGMHASAERKAFSGCILDFDVASFYPNIAIRNQVYPQHLGRTFCHVYETLYDRRREFPKGSAHNVALKLALNSVYGKSNSEWSPLFDPAYMLTITINGQLLLLTLAERLASVPTVEFIQMNTDGITVKVEPEHRAAAEAVVAEWSAATLMPTETGVYSRMWIRDVNNYIAEYADGKVKRKGAYEYKREWHQDHSMAVVRKAAEAAMLHGTDPETFLRAHDDPFDFMMRIKVGKGSHLILDYGHGIRELHTGLVRYYVSAAGASAVKKMPSTTTRLHAGGHAQLTGARGAYGCNMCDWIGKTKKAFVEHSEAAHASKITPCNNYDGRPIDPDFRFYLGEVRKLIIEGAPAPAPISSGGSDAEIEERLVDRYGPRAVHVLCDLVCGSAA